MKEKYLAVWRKENGESDWKFVFTLDDAEKYFAKQRLTEFDTRYVCEVNAVEYRMKISELESKLKAINEIIKAP